MHPEHLRDDYIANNESSFTSGTKKPAPTPSRQRIAKKVSRARTSSSVDMASTSTAAAADCETWHLPIVATVIGAGEEQQQQQQEHHAKFPPVHISFKVFDNGSCLCNEPDLRDLHNDFFSRCFSQKKDYFVFNMFIPDVIQRVKENVYGTSYMQYVSYGPINHLIQYEILII